MCTCSSDLRLSLEVQPLRPARAGGVRRAGPPGRPRGGRGRRLDSPGADGSRSRGGRPRPARHGARQAAPAHERRELARARLARPPPQRLAHLRRPRRAAGQRLAHRAARVLRRRARVRAAAAAGPRRGAACADYRLLVWYYN